MQKKARFDSDYEESSSSEYEGECPGSGGAHLKKKRLLTRKFTRLAVIDLDQTLIDNKYKLLEGADTFLSQLNRNGFYILLWTAGDDNHVKTFFKDYPLCKLYINDYITGLTNGAKPVSQARKKLFSKLHSYLGANIFIDDNLGNIQKSDYDYKFCVLDYADSSGGVNFVRLLANIKKIK